MLVHGRRRNVNPDTPGLSDCILFRMPRPPYSVIPSECGDAPADTMRPSSASRQRLRWVLRIRNKAFELRVYFGIRNSAFGFARFGASKVEHCHLFDWAYASRP